MELINRHCKLNIFPKNILNSISKDMLQVMSNCAQSRFQTPVKHFKIDFRENSYRLILNVWQGSKYAE